MKTLIADDHAVVRKGLVQLLVENFPAAEITEVSNSQEVIEHVKKTSWDLILLDISMPGRNGVDALKQLRSIGTKTPILILSMHPEDQYAVRVLKAGASGYINKETAPEDLVAAVRRVLSGHKYITPETAEMLAEATSRKSKELLHENLSDREMQVLQLIASGKTVSDIADQLSLSVNTISTYRTRILEKLSLQNNAELTRYAIENALV